jgi:hypothetical protein
VKPLDPINPNFANAGVNSSRAHEIEWQELESGTRPAKALARFAGFITKIVRLKKTDGCNGQSGDRECVYRPRAPSHKQVFFSFSDPRNIFSEI